MQIFSTYTGSDFLMFYLLMLATCVFAGLWIPANLRPTGRRGEITQADEMAVLAGGRERHAQAVTTDLLARGGITPASKGKLRALRDEVRAKSEIGAAGRSLLRKAGEFNWRDIGVTIAADAALIERGLIRSGLVMTPAERTKLRWQSVMPYAALMALGLYRWQAGSAAGEPTGLLVMLLILTAFFAIFRFFKANRRTAGGNETLRAAEASAARMRAAPMPHEAGYAVALYGTAILVGTPWEPVHAMRQAGGGADANSGNDSDRSGGGSDGGGGCGGGCGGCGG